MTTYNDNQRKEAVKSRLKKILDGPKPDYPEPRKTGKIVMSVNGRKTIVILKPYAKNITQWVVTINGKHFSDHCGMSQVYAELARRHPLARNFY